MVLVDTSVWVRALSNLGQYIKELDRLLARDEVGGHPFVYGELLIGDPGGRLKLLSAYDQIRQARMARHDEVVAFARHRGLHGRGIGWIDVHLLASTVLDQIQLWTADVRFSAVFAPRTWASPITRGDLPLTSVVGDCWTI